MLFSVLVANYNNGKFFKDCYDSLIAQTYANWEAIIVDDGSTDDSVNMIKAIIGNDHRFHFYTNDGNYGCGYTKNKCAALANGDVCGFVDPDDAINPNAIEIMIMVHEKEPRASLVYSRLVFCDENLMITSDSPYPKSVILNESFTNLDYAVNHFATFKKESYLKTEGIACDLSRAVDQDLYLKLSEEVGEFIFLDEVLYKYRIHKGGISTAAGKKAFYSHLKAIFKAEQRRGVSLEDAVAPYLNGYKEVEINYENRLGSFKYLWARLLNLILKRTKSFFRKDLK